MRFFGVACLLLLFLQSSARSWRDIPPLHDLAFRPDLDGQQFLRLQEQKYRLEASRSGSGISPALSSSPSLLASSSNRPSVPVVVPTVAPNQSPSTGIPTDSPSLFPTTFPTSSPTPKPDPFLPNELPENPEAWYFNYDLSEDSKYGPGELGIVLKDQTFQVGIKNDRWGSVSRPPDDYWKEFAYNGYGPWSDVLADHRPLRNVCATGTLQSPIDVRESGATCEEFHEVRSLRGDFQVRGKHVQKRIESNKLRLVYERRPCANWDKKECQEPDPPHADFPNGWGGFADVMHVDIKVPSEHTILGERFDAEMMIFHLHAGNQRMAAQSVVIRAKQNGYNYYFQEALDQFQKEYNKNSVKCRRRMKRKMQMATHQIHRSTQANVTRSSFDYLTWARNSTFVDENGHLQKVQQLEEFEGGPWDPHHSMLIPTIHFYRYDGSLTEPPCGEFVSWWIADKPMTISFGQLKQLKIILFTNVDSDCKKTSVHFNQSVARPIRNTNGRAVWKCTPANFGPDP